MITITLLITKDYYLYTALRYLIPGLEWVESSDVSRFKKMDHKQDYRLIIDSRFSYVQYFRLHAYIYKHRIGKDCILLNMTNPIFFRKGYPAMKEVNMSRAFDQSVSDLIKRFGECSYFPAVRKDVLGSLIKKNQNEILGMLMRGGSTRLISQKFNMSFEHIYYRRRALYHSLGFKSYIHLHIFLLQNGFLNGKGQRHMGYI